MKHFAGAGDDWRAGIITDVGGGVVPTAITPTPAGSPKRDPGMELWKRGDVESDIFVPVSS